MEICPRNVTERNIALKLLDNLFCLLWKSEGVGLNQTLRELKDNFKKVGNYITQESGKSHFIYDFIPKKIESHLTNFITYDLETHNTDRARPYVFCFYRLSKIAGRYSRDLTPYEIEKCKNILLHLMGISVLITL